MRSERKKRRPSLINILGSRRQAVALLFLSRLSLFSCSRSLHGHPTLPQHPSRPSGVDTSELGRWTRFGGKGGDLLKGGRTVSQHSPAHEVGCLRSLPVRSGALGAPQSGRRTRARARVGGRTRASGDQKRQVCCDCLQEEAKGAMHRVSSATPEATLHPTRYQERREWHGASAGYRWDMMHLSWNPRWRRLLGHHDPNERRSSFRTVASELLEPGSSSLSIKSGLGHPTRRVPYALPVHG